ncbi:unnamed protein product [Pieris macdunnoughi]|uniref:Uncharacterized protein n=1 Tax=Pieris macdunnoughi TaxID=345717 RepID=A0A821UJI7_9NEOP|nr:unnamed protein product [Pieris macdunnoughi]
MALKVSQKHREEGRPIYYLDETWVNAVKFKGGCHPCFYGGGSYDDGVERVGRSRDPIGSSIYPGVGLYFIEVGNARADTPESGEFPPLVDTPTGPPDRGGGDHCGRLVYARWWCGKGGKSWQTEPKSTESIECGNAQMEDAEGEEGGLLLDVRD